MTLRVYFAHPMVDYNTAREGTALLAIEQYFGYGKEIINPNRPIHEAGYQERGEFAYWTDLAASCDYVVFMAMPGEEKPIGSAARDEDDFRLQRRPLITIGCGLLTFDVEGLEA